MSCGSGSTAGSITQLIAVGAMDAYLTMNATKTYFKAKHARHTNFAMESVCQPFNTMVQFGAEAQCTLNRVGDLIHYQYVMIDLPGLTVCESETEKCGIMAQFPSCDDPEAPAAQNDMEVYLDYLTLATEQAVQQQVRDDATVVEDEKDKTATSRMSEIGHARFTRDLYEACAPLDCCASRDDTMQTATQRTLDPKTGTYGQVADAGGGNKAPWAHWVNAIGQQLVRSARVVIGGATVDTLYSDYLYMWEELSGKPGKRLAEMIGKRHRRMQLVCDSRAKRRLYVPLPFWYALDVGSSLSLTSLQFHGVQLCVQFEALERCIVISKGASSASNIQVYNCASGCCMNNSDLKASLLTSYVYLDQDERDLFSMAKHETLITQIQTLTLQTTNQQVRVSLNFNHPVIELIWAIRRQCNENCNNWFNYSGIDGRDPIESVRLTLNSQSRFDFGAEYFRLVQPYQHHTNIPDSYVYCYSFALEPEGAAPSGSCNFSRIDNIDLTVTLQPHLGKEQCTLIIFARTWNVYRYRDGLGGVAYSN